MPKSAQNDKQPTSLIEPMDMQTLYAGGDFAYMQDDRSSFNSDDDVDTTVTDDDLPEPDTGGAVDDDPADDDTTGDADDDATDDDATDDDDAPATKGKKSKTPAKDDDDDDDADDSDDESVPRWRLNQQTKKLRQAEREKQELERQLKRMREGDNDAARKEEPQADPEAQVQAQLTQLRTQREQLRDEYEVAIIDGDNKRSKTLRAQIDALDDQIFETRLEARSKKVMKESQSQTALQTELDMAAEKVAAKYDAFNANHEFYDEDMVTEVVAYRNALMQMGKKPSLALQEAADTIALKYGVDPNTADNTPAPKPAKKTEARSKGKREKVKKAQPAKMPGQRNQPKLHDVASMTDEEFDKLSPQERAKLRGDYRVE